MSTALVCEKCGTEYDISAYEPGQRFRCRGEGCGELGFVCHDTNIAAEREVHAVSCCGTVQRCDCRCIQMVQDRGGCVP